MFFSPAGGSSCTRSATRRRRFPGGGVSLQDLYDTFADGWEIESVESVEESGRPAVATESSEEYVWKMRFAVIRRKG